MDISFIDNLAYNTNSLMHRASALSKMIMVALVITTVVISARPAVLGVALIVLIIALLLANLPVARVLGFASYALFFSLVFAFSAGGGLMVRVVIVLKAVTAAVSLLLLITTTPYPQVFGILQKVLPGALVDIMIVTYRSFFILVGEITSRVTAIRLRGGYSPLRIAKNLNAVGGIIGNGFVHAWELSESMQDAMYIRGYAGRLPVGFSWQSFTGYDVLPLSIGALILSLAVVG